MSVCEVPESLELWARLNDLYEQREDEGASRAELDEIYARIDEAWLDAPRGDRLRVDWRMLKKAWREMRERQERGDR